MKSQVFINEISCLFYLRQTLKSKPTIVYMVVRMDKKQYKFTTQTKVYPEHWNKSKQQAYISVRLTERDNLNNEIVNERLNEIQDEFQKFKQYLCEHPLGDIDKIDLLRQYIYKDKMTKKAKQKDAIVWLNQALLSDRTIKESTKLDYLKQIRFF